MLLAASAHASLYTRALAYLPRIGALLTALLAALALAGLIRSVYRRTLGRRRDRYGRLRRLGANAQLSFFTSVLGEPPAMRRSVEGQVTRFDDVGERYAESRTFIEAVYIDRDFYVHAVADVDETVLAYSVTTRSKRFRPTFRPPGAFFEERRWPFKRWERLHFRVKRQPSITLGKTRFAELDRPDSAASWVGAHNAHYFETHYLGNPSYYQTFVYSVNDSGAWAFDAPFNAMEPDLRWGFGVDPVPRATADADVAEIQEEATGDVAFDDLGTPGEGRTLPAALQAFRQHARINTYTVIGPEFIIDDYPGAEGRIDTYPIIFGANSGSVRTLGWA